MAFTEKQEYKIEVLENGTLQIRRSDIILKDDVEVGRTFHRHCVHPGDDVSSEAQRVQDVASATWTTEVVTAYEASLPEPLPAPIEEEPTPNLVPEPEPEPAEA